MPFVEGAPHHKSDLGPPSGAAEPSPQREPQAASPAPSTSRLPRRPGEGEQNEGGGRSSQGLRPGPAYAGFRSCRG